MHHLKTPCPMAILPAMSGGARRAASRRSAQASRHREQSEQPILGPSAVPDGPNESRTSTPRYRRRSGCPESAVWTMVDHPRANPATSATPTPALVRPRAHLACDQPVRQRRPEEQDIHQHKRTWRPVPSRGHPRRCHQRHHQKTQRHQRRAQHRPAQL